MGIGISGINSGMDTDSIVEALVMEKTAKRDQLVKAQKKLEWKQDAWKELNTKIYSFYTKSLSNMRLIGNYNKKTTSVSDPSIATVVATSNSVNGTQTLGVEQLAKSGYLTGGRVSTASGEKVSSNTKLSDLATQSGQQVSSGSINITVAGKESVITIDGDTTVNDFVKQLQAAGVNASFDAGNQRFFISSKDSGKDNDFSLTAAGGNGIANLKALGLYTGASQADVAQYSTWAGYSQEKINELIEEAYNGQLTNVDKERENFNKEIESLTTSNENLNKANQTLTEAKTLLLYQRDYASRYLDHTSSDYYNDVKTRLADYDDRISKGETLSETEQADYDDLTIQMKAIEIVDKAIGDETKYGEEDRQNYIDELTKSIDEKDAAIAANNKTIADNEASIAEKQGIVGSETELQKYVDDQNAALHDQLEQEYTQKWETAKNYMVQYNYNKLADYDARIAKGETLSETEQADYAALNDLKAQDPDAFQNAYDAAVAAIGDINYTQADDGTGAVRIDGQNAVIYLNGAKFENSSNSMTVNGLTITAQELTGTDENGKLKTVSITTSQDTEGIYNMVKDFLNSYNELINEMDSLYNADSAKGYEPLTDDEKAAMSDKEIELWEEKVKSALLRRDSSLNSIIQVLKNSMAGGVTIDGKKSYLSEFGIETGGYLYAAENERGAYHIDGDEDDTLFKDKSNKLMSAIIADPDRVAEVISGIATKLYDNMTQAMRSTTLSSSYTAYNDKQMKEEYNSYTEKIAAQEEKITWWEDYYRSKFTTMETMLASLNQQQSSLSGLFG